MIALKAYFKSLLVMSCDLNVSRDGAFFAWVMRQRTNSRQIKFKTTGIMAVFHDNVQVVCNANHKRIICFVSYQTQFVRIIIR